MTDVKTKYTLQFEGKGVDQLQKQVEGVAKSASPENLASGFKRMEHFMQRNERQIRGMEKSFKGLNQSLRKFGSTVNKINKMADALGKVKDNAKGAGEEAKKASRFIQGLIQGAGIGEFIPSGPGMGKQVAGRLLGRAGTTPLRMAAGFAQAPVSGVGGLAAGLGAIPGFGGPLGSVVGAAAQNVSQFRQFERMQLGLAPFLDVSAGATAREGALRGSGARINDAGQRAQDAAAAARIQAVSPTTFQGTRGELSAIGSSAGAQGGLGASVRAAVEERIRTEEAARASAASRAAMGTQGLAGLGVSLGGINLQQTTQFAGQVAGAAGGRMSGLRGGPGGDLVAAALAAQTTFGVGPEVAGAFGRAGRRGGLTGAQGSGGRDFADILERAVAAGMDATEVREFMAETAQGIQSFRMTGIPMSPETVLSLGREFSKSGLELGRSQFIGGTLAQRTKQVGMQGPQSAADFLLLQTVGGFQGGGLEQFQSARQRLLDLKPGGETTAGFQKFLQRISGGAGGGASGQISMENVLRGMGANIGPNESQALQALVEGRNVPTELRETLTRVQTDIGIGTREAPRGIEGLKARAQATVTELGSTLRDRASIENKQFEVGAKLAGTVDRLEQTMVTAQTSVAQFATNLQGLAELLLQVTDATIGASKRKFEASVAEKTP